MSLTNSRVGVASEYKRESKPLCVRCRLISLSNIVIIILITGVEEEEALNVVKMMRLVVFVSVITLGNSHIQQPVLCLSARVAQ